MFQKQKSHKKEIKIRVGTFNLAASSKEVTIAQRKLLEQHQIDIVGLQEVDEYTQRNPYSMLTTLKNKQYMYGYFTQTMNFENGRYGLATISKLPIKKENSHEYEFQDGMEEPRIYQHSIIAYKDLNISVYNTHLSYENSAIRERQFNQLLRQLKQDKLKYKVILGDFNTDESHIEWESIKKEYLVLNGNNNQWYDTYNKIDDSMKLYAIDNIIVSTNIKVTQINMVETTLSDHNLLLADLVLV